jgi:hypothetical protein
MSRRQSLLLLILSIIILSPPDVTAQPRQRQAGARAAQAAGKSVEASGFPGSDLGAKINAADRALGAAAGEIVARGGGRITTPVVISEGHTLRLMEGTYVPVTADIPILLKPGSSIVGAGWDRTVVLESPAKNQFTVIAAHNGARRNGDSDWNLAVRDLQVKGANPEFSSAPQAIALGNCKNCVVERVWVNGTRSIGVQLGGSAQYGNMAEDSRVVNCLFTNVASQNLALVNGRNITFENNRFVNPGQPGGPGSTVIDLEPNAADDHLQNVVVRNNLIDARTATAGTGGNGILVQSGSGTKFVGPVLVEGNTIYGGNNQPPNITSNLSNGIYCFGHTMRDVTIRNNKVTRMGQTGMRLEGTHFTVLNNQFTDVGGGGTPGFYLADVSDSRFENNTFVYTGVGPADGTTLIVGQFKNNVTRNNKGLGYPLNHDAP